MNDQLERFIKQHRPAFDTDVPNAALWDRIDDAVNGSKGHRISIWRIISIAAAVVLLLTTGTFLGIQLERQHQQQAGILIELPAEVEELEDHYQRRIKRQLAKLNNFNDYSGTVEEDLKELEMFMLALKKELHNTPEAGRDDVIAAMISNYKARLEILEKVLSKLENESTDQKQNKFRQ